MRRTSLAGQQRQHDDKDAFSNWRNPSRPSAKAVEQGSRITGINREIGGRRAGVGWANSSDEAEQCPWSKAALLVYNSFETKEAGAR
jgi:hypothetical protein